MHKGKKSYIFTMNFGSDDDDSARTDLANLLGMYLRYKAYNNPGPQPGGATISGYSMTWQEDGDRPGYHAFRCLGRIMRIDDGRTDCPMCGTDKAMWPKLDEYK